MGTSEYLEKRDKEDSVREHISMQTHWPNVKGLNGMRKKFEEWKWTKQEKKEQQSQQKKTNWNKIKRKIYLSTHELTLNPNLVQKFG